MDRQGRHQQRVKSWAGHGADATGADRLPRATVFAYGIPTVGAGYMYLLIGLYVMKFSTDVLLISPLVMGLIFSASRVWDAVSDPLVGYLSDRTRLPFGRQRTWMAASIVPICATFVMIFARPDRVSPTRDTSSGWPSRSSGSIP